MSQHVRFSYSRSSPARLTATEENTLAEHLRQRWADALTLPLSVHEGYDLYSTGSELTVGRAYLYELQALERLKQGKDDRRLLRGLYFPTATPSRDLLCQATLYFDEFYVIHPGSTVLSHLQFRHPHGDRDEQAAEAYVESHEQFKQRLAAFDEQALELKRAGVLYSLPPQMHKHPNFVELLTADLGDAQFEKIVSDHWTSPVFVAAEKMESILPLVGDGKDVNEVRAELTCRSTYGSFREQDTADLFEPRYHGVKEVHPLLAATILLNHAFLLSDHFELIPFTDDDISTRLLQRKLQRVAATSGFSDYKRQLNLSSASLAVRVLDEYLPNFEFSRVSDALEARDKLRDQLAAFRDAMQSFAAEIEQSPYDQGFSEKIERIVAGKIRPAVRQLENDIEKSRDSFISKCLKNARSGSLPIAVSIFAGLPAEAVLAISAGIMTFGAAIETYREVRRTKANGLTLLLGQ